MKIQRTKNTIKGSVWGIIENLSNMFLPFLVRTVLLYKLGIEYIGLNSLFASILQVLSLTELGFASATVFAMYKPIAIDDYKTVGAIVFYLKKIYKYIGVIMLVTGGLLIPFLPNLVNGEVPYGINMYLLYLIYLFNSASSYFFMGYKSSLLNAMQCNNIISEVGFATNTVLRTLQCISVLLWSNYYIFTILIPIITITNNLIKSIIVDKNYSKYLVHNELNYGLKKDIRSRLFPLMSTKLAGVLINSADTLVISAFLGLTETAKYNNYYFILTSIQTLIFVVHSSMQAGIGNSLVIDNKISILNNFRKLNFINSWLISFCTTCFLCLYQPFITLWVGSDFLLSYKMVILFSGYFYATTILRVVVIYKDAAGIWKEDMFRCYLSCATNIILNIILVRYIGLYGVIGSSVFVSFFIDPWIANTLYKKLFKEPSSGFYMDLIKGLFICIVTSCLCITICSFMPDGIWGLALRALICCIIGNILLFMFYRKNIYFFESLKWIYSKLPEKFHIKK